ncbi:MAG TPA: polysaccharide deacetylase family protein [Kofleriaceae bacterium]
MRFAILALLTGCQADLGDIDGAFYDGDGRAVHCAVDLDLIANNSIASIDTALDRAAARGEVVELYAHSPGKTVPYDTIEHVLAGAVSRGLPFVTYADFATTDVQGPGLALSFDDHNIVEWYSLRPMFERHGARVTFFLSRYAYLGELEYQNLRELAGDGHAVEAHSVNHLRAPLYVEERGLAAYLADEVIPSIEVLENDGYPVHAYAYPFGARTDELDDAIREHVPILRSISFSYQGVITSPCPR